MHYELCRGFTPQPGIKVIAGRLHQLLEFATENATGSMTQREAAGNAIRKALERFVSETLDKLGIQISKRLLLKKTIEALNGSAVSSIESSEARDKEGSLDETGIFVDTPLLIIP